MHALFAASLKSARYVLWGLADLADRALGRVEPMTPPRRLRFVGSNELLRNDYHAIGRELLDYLVRVGGLTANDRVLDVGCGVGRIAAQLVNYLDADGSYDGFDIVQEAIDWCSRNISTVRPDFRFVHSDIANTQYNPGGAHLARNYRFPYGDGEFTYVILTSVATHVLKPDLENYVKEISRVLRDGGRCFVTFFLINPQSAEQINRGQAAFRFAFSVDDTRVNDAGVPEAAVAYPESYVRALLGAHGMAIVEPIRFGSWTRCTSEVGFQDIVVARKAG